MRLFLSDGGAEAKAMELFAEVAHRNSASTPDTAFFIRIKKGDFRVTIFSLIFVLICFSKYISYIFIDDVFKSVSVDR